MPEPLDFDQAKRYAQMLTAIPECTRFDSALDAIAADLVEWCTGYVSRDQLWQPAEQAAWLVTEARKTFTKWAGTGELYDLFSRKFPRKEKEFVPATEADLIRRGLLCGRCLGTGEVHGNYCQCSVGRDKRKWDAMPALMTEPPVQKVRSIRTPEQKADLERRWALFANGAGRFAEDEERRKREQLYQLGLDAPSQERAS